MALLNRNYQQAQQFSERQLQERKFASARNNLLLMLIISAANILLMLLSKSDAYIFFSAFTPWFIVLMGMSNSGMFPAEFYGEGYESAMFLDESFAYVMLVIAIVLLVPYLLCWIMSKKGKAGWMVFALVWYCLDSAVMLLIGVSTGLLGTLLLGYLFHAWVLYYLFTGVSSAKKLKTMPVDVVETFDFAPAAEETEE